MVADTNCPPIDWPMEVTLDDRIDGLTAAVSELTDEIAALTDMLHKAMLPAMIVHDEVSDMAWQDFRRKMADLQRETD